MKGEYILKKMLDLSNCVPQELAVKASYADLLEAVWDIEVFEERQAVTLDYIVMKRLQLILTGNLSKEALLFQEFISRVLCEKHRGKFSNIAGVNYFERWLGYHALMEDFFHHLMFLQDPTSSPGGLARYFAAEEKRLQADKETRKSISEKLLKLIENEELRVFIQDEAVVSVFSEWGRMSTKFRFGGKAQYFLKNLRTLRRCWQKAVKIEITRWPDCIDVNFVAYPDISLFGRFSELFPERARE